MKVKLKQKAGLLVALVLLSTVTAIGGGLTGGSGTHTRDVTLEPVSRNTGILVDHTLTVESTSGDNIYKVRLEVPSTPDNLYAYYRITSITTPENWSYVWWPDFYGWPIVIEWSTPYDVSEIAPGATEIFGFEAWTPTLEGEWTWWVRTTDDENYTENSTLVTETDDTPPSVPTDLTVTDEADAEGSLVISWTAPPEADLAGYELWFSPDGVEWSLEATLGLVTSYTDTGLVDGEDYFYMISAFDEVPNYSDNTAPVAGVPIDDLAPSVPTDLTVTDEADAEGSLVISWTAPPEADLAGYELWFSPDGVEWSLEATLGLVTSYTDTGLVDGEDYFYMISAFDEVPNYSDNTAPVAGVPIDDLAPSVPTLVWPEDEALINDNTPNLDWDAIIDPSGVTYDVQVANNPDFVSPIEDITEIVDDNYQVAVALIEGTWYWRVRAVDGAGNVGVWSLTWSFTVDVTFPTLTISISGTVTEIDNVGLEARGTITITVVSDEPLSSLDVDVEYPYEPYSTSVDMAPENEDNITWTGEFTIEGWGWHTIYATGWDLAGNENEASLGFNGLPWLEEYIDLYPGWNLISLPLMPDNAAVAALMATLENENMVLGIWTYDAIIGWTWAVRDPVLGWVGDLTTGVYSNPTMQTLWGYWIKLMDYDTLTVEGLFLREREVPPSRYLGEGWNLIGLHSMDEILIESALFSIQDRWGSLWTYDAEYGWIRAAWYDGTWYWFIEGLYEEGWMLPGYGYWIFMVQDGTLVP